MIKTTYTIGTFFIGIGITKYGLVYPNIGGLLDGYSAINHISVYNLYPTWESIPEYFRAGYISSALIAEYIAMMTSLANQGLVDPIYHVTNIMLISESPFYVSVYGHLITGPATDLSVHITPFPWLVEGSEAFTQDVQCEFPELLIGPYGSEDNSQVVTRTFDNSFIANLF